MHSPAENRLGLEIQSFQAQFRGSQLRKLRAAELRLETLSFDIEADLSWRVRAALVQALSSTIIEARTPRQLLSYTWVIFQFGLISSTSKFPELWQMFPEA
jgi:hypothetical protein